MNGETDWELGALTPELLYLVESRATRCLESGTEGMVVSVMGVLAMIARIRELERLAGHIERRKDHRQTAEL